MKEEIRKKCIIHYKQLRKIFPKIVEKDPITACRYLRKIEQQITRINEAYCNGEEITDNRDELFMTVKEYLHDTNNILHLNQDPRGYALKIRDDVMNDKVLHRDWGGYGIIAPDLSEGD